MLVEFNLEQCFVENIDALGGSDLALRLTKPRSTCLWEKGLCQMCRLFIPDCSSRQKALEGEQGRRWGVLSCVSMLVILQSEELSLMERMHENGRAISTMARGMKTMFLHPNRERY